MDYKAIARRFRPKSFSEVTGQEAIVKTLRNAVLQKRAAHAYLFTGIRGTGKTTLARIFAKALNCEAITSEGEPCNACPSCLEIAQGKSLDFVEIDGASNRGIDDIRNLNENLSYRAVKGRYKIYLIDEVHMLTKEAFNALLKSLEEPPSHVKFFFATTEPNKVLPTILSRCQRFDLARIPNHAIMKKLKSIAKEVEVEVGDEALATIARFSEGSLRDAESLFDQVICLGNSPILAHHVLDILGFVPREEFFALDEAFKNEDLAFAFTLAGKLFASGRDITYFLENLLEHYRNLMLIHLKHLRIEDAAMTEEEKRGYQRGLEIYARPALLHILDYLSELIYQSQRPMVKKVHLEMILIHILQSKKRVALDTIIAAISKGEIKKNLAIEEPNTLQEKPSFVYAVPEEIAKKEPVEEAPRVIPSVRHDTILRFAQVELGGSLKKV